MANEEKQIYLIVDKDHRITWQHTKDIVAWAEKNDVSLVVLDFSYSGEIQVKCREADAAAMVKDIPWAGSYQKFEPIK